MNNTVDACLLAVLKTYCSHSTVLTAGNNTNYITLEMKGKFSGFLQVPKNPEIYL